MKKSLVSLAFNSFLNKSTADCRYPKPTFQVSALPLVRQSAAAVVFARGHHGCCCSNPGPAARDVRLHRVLPFGRACFKSYYSETLKNQFGGNSFDYIFKGSIALVSHNTLK